MLNSKGVFNVMYVNACLMSRLLNIMFILHAMQTFTSNSEYLMSTHVTVCLTNFASNFLNATLG